MSPSIERIKVIRQDGTGFATGKEVRVEVTVWASSSGYGSEQLDLLVAADALNPAWTNLTTLAPTASGSQVLATSIILPAGGLQALRAQYRAGGTLAECSTGATDDHDDLVFAVGVETDSEPPSVAVTAPAAGATVSGTITVTASASDNFGVVSVDFYEGATLLGTDTSAPYSVAWNTRLGPNGSHSLTALARDAAGMVTTSAEVVLTADNDFTAPVTAVTSPVAGASVEETVTIQATATDDRGVSWVEFLVDGTPFVSDLYSPYSVSWSTRSVPNGNHILTTTARDAAGNVGTSAEVAVVVNNDVTPPQTSIVSPASGAAVSGTVTIEAAASDDRAVSRVEILVDGALLATVTSAPYVASWDSTVAPSGTISLTSRAYDAFGNVGTSAATVVVTSNPGNAGYDATFRAPTCGAVGSRCDTTTLVKGRGPVGPERDAPNNLYGACPDGVNGSYRSDESVERIRITRLDGTDFAPGKRVRIDVDVWAYSSYGDHLDLYYAADAANPAWVYLTTLSPPGYGAQVISADLLLQAGGPLQAVRAHFRYYGSPTPCSTSGYDESDDVVFAVGQDVDTTPPVVSISSPAPGAALNGTVAVSAAASDNFDVTRVDLYAGAELLGTATNPPYTVSWNTRAVPNGNYTLTAVAFDAAGHVTTSAAVEVSADNDYVAPAVAITYPAPGMLVSGTVQLEASAADDRGVAKVEYYDGATLIGTATVPSYLVAWNSRTGASGSHTLTARAYDAAGNTATSEAVAVVVDNDFVAPTTAILSPSNGSALSGTVQVAVSASDDRALGRVEFYAGPALVHTWTAAPYELAWDTSDLADGAYTLTSKAYDVSGNVGTSAAVTVTLHQPTHAAYDPVLRAPKCDTVQAKCDTVGLVNGRAILGPEPSQPNTIGGTCADGTSGSYHYDESLDRIRVTREDGTAFAAGKRVRIEANVWVYSASSDYLDLYYASDATSPTWVYLTTLRPGADGAQLLSTEYVLPSGSLQAVRGNFRYSGSVGSCTSGSYDDRDDLRLRRGTGAGYRAAGGDDDLSRGRDDRGCQRHARGDGERRLRRDPGRVLRWYEPDWHGDVRAIPGDVVEPSGRQPQPDRERLRRRRERRDLASGSPRGQSHPARLVHHLSAGWGVPPRVGADRGDRERSRRRLEGRVLRRLVLRRDGRHCALLRDLEHRGDIFREPHPDRPGL